MLSYTIDHQTCGQKKKVSGGHLDFIPPQGGGGGDPSVLDANYPPQLTVGRRPLWGGGGALEGEFREGRMGGGVRRGRGGGGGSGI